MKTPKPLIFTAINSKQDKLPTGTSGQVWTAGSDGSGSWQEPAGGGDWIIASSKSEVIDISTYTVLHDFEIMYIYGSYTSPWMKIAAGKYWSPIFLGRIYGAPKKDEQSYIGISGSTITIDCAGQSASLLTAMPTAPLSSSSYAAIIRYKA